MLSALLLLVWRAPPVHGFEGLAYLPLHTFVETFAVAVAAMIFGVGWNAYGAERPGNITVLACAFLAVSLLDFGHFMSFSGMPDFVTPSSPQKAINFWLAARLWAAAWLLAAVMLPWRPFASPRPRYLLMAASLVFTGLVYWLVLFHEQDLPATFIPGKGLTLFKVGAEYFVILLHLVAAAILAARVRLPQPYDVNGLLVAVFAMVLSELCFTLYSDVTDAFNLLGHIYKVVAYLFLYRAVFVAGVREPYERLRQSERLVWQEKERAEVTLHSIGDAVITTDAEGRVEYLNPVAEALTGWSSAQARGLPLAQVFNIINESTRQTVASPVERCIAECRAVGSANHTVLIRRDGQEFAIDDSAAPIRDRNGGIAGAVMVFHDVSARRRAREALRESEERLRTLINAMPDVVCFKDGEGRWLEANEFAVRAFGIADISYRGRASDELAASGASRGDIFRSCISSDEQAWQAKKATRTEWAIPQPDGSVMTLDVIGVPLFHPDGRRKGLVTVGRDVTERMRLEKQLRQLAAIVEATPDCVGIASAEGRLLYVNQACRRLFGIGDDEDVRGQHIQAFHPEWAYRVVRESGMPAAIEKGMWHAETEVVARDGRIIPVSQVITAHRTPDGKIAFLAAILRDLSERKQFERQLAHMAHHDALTGLPNRLLFKDRLDLALAQAHRSKERLAVMFVDLDRFKTINDTLGHATGDQLLKMAAERLQCCVREGDTVARFGGDEFAVILPNLAQSQDAAVVAHKICDVLQQHFKLEKHEVVATASIGIALFPDDDATADGLVKNADTAMYRAKKQGRNTYEFYTPDMNARAFEQLAMENSLRRALERGEMMLHYQPRVSLKSGRITGAEALLRWRNPELGMVSPGQFIPIAEESGIIVPIGEWVLRTACAQNKAWQDAGYPPINIAVNLSVRQFRDSRLIEAVSGALQESGLDARHLELELTESVLMENAQAPVVILRHFKQMGIRIAIDDFGTGFSSLSYLKHFPLDQLKVDQSFVRDISSDPNDAAIVTAIIAMARSLKLEVVAEGVETPEQLAFLRSNRCDEMQGYYFSRPVPPEEFAALLQQECRLELS